MTRVEGGTQRQGQSKGGWYNPACCPTARLLKIQIQTVVSFPFSRWDRDALPSIRIHDSKVLVSIGKIFGDAFHEGIERVAEEDVIGGIQHYLHLEVNVNVIKAEPDILEVAMHFSDG
jgi:hypothetical protein